MAPSRSPHLKPPSLPHQRLKPLSLKLNLPHQRLKPLSLELNLPHQRLKLSLKLNLPHQHLKPLSPCHQHLRALRQ